MKFEEYMKQRNALKAEGMELAKAGKIQEAEAKTLEINKLDADYQAAKEQQAEENALEDKQVIPAAIQNEQKLGEETEMSAKIYDASSVEYRNAFLKHISGRDDEMTKLENTAFTHTTGNTGNVLPTTMLNEIWDLVFIEEPPRVEVCFVHLHLFLTVLLEIGIVATGWETASAWFLCRIWKFHQLIVESW